MAKREYDLTQRMAPFMDIHLLFPILDFLSEQDIYPHKEILKVQMDLAGKTSMIKYELGFHDELHGIKRAEDDETLPERFEAKKAEIIAKNEDLSEACQPLLMIKDDAEKLTALKKKIK